MARRRRNSSQRWLALVVVIGGGAAYWWYAGDRSATDAELGARSPIPLASDRPDTASPDGGPNGDVPERGTAPTDAADDRRLDPQKGRALAAAARDALQHGRLIAARAQFSEALEYELPLDELVQLKADATRVAAETIFSQRILADDPYVVTHTIQPGETLGKIAKQYSVTADFLARINGIADKNRIRGGQRIKVVQGPFHAVVTKANYSLDMYLHGTLVKHYTVGLGAEDSTPSGRWLVRDKLKNPQYYPPRGGQIILADDPENPLGERWVGLEGIEGDAVGQLRYGIHGTIEPDSIGKSISLGCIRMYNADVEELFDVLVEQKSEVTVR